MERDELIQALKALVAEECDTDVSAQEITADEQLIGSDTRLGLDSLDALQIALAVKSQYGKRIEEGTDSRRALASINALADFILSDQ